MTRIQLTTEIEAPTAICFDLCLNVDVQLSLDRGMRAVGGVQAGPLHQGDRVAWQARHFGLPWRMTSGIIEVDRPRCFADRMQSGPFADWHHVHTFEETGNGTRMRDDVEYHPPLGPLGRLFDAAVLERYLTRLLKARNGRLKGLVEKTVAKGAAQ
ncbi:MAG: SRPBCC family protein [Chloroflexi bacterium]|nr:SRPBCC family protein [Chloroflexota bacterium]